MNYDNALQILELETDYDSKCLRKAYLKKSLKYHPDKNNGKDIDDRFKNVNEAYEFLSRFNKNDHRSSSKFSNYTSSSILLSDILKECVNIFTPSTSESKGNVLNKIVSIISNLNSCKERIAIKVFQELDEDSSRDIYNYISKYKHIFNVSNDFLSTIREILNSKSENLPIISLKPQIGDLLNAKIFIYKEDDIKYFIPLWHQELHFDKYIFDIQPILPDTIYIDDDNNIFVEKHITSEELIKSKNIDIIIDDRMFLIHRSIIKLVGFQIIKIENNGIPIINDNDIYDVSNKSSINVELHIKF